MEQERAAAVPRGSRDAQGSSASQHCALLRLLGSAQPKAEMHCPRDGTHDFRDTQTVSTYPLCFHLCCNYFFLLLIFGCAGSFQRDFVLSIFSLNLSVFAHSFILNLDLKEDGKPLIFDWMVAGLVQVALPEAVCTMILTDKHTIEK